MAGREKVEVYVYNNDFTYNRTINSIKEASVKYKTNKNFLTKQHAPDGIREMPNGEFACTSRRTQTEIRAYIKRKNSPYLGTYKGSNKQVILKNLDGEVMATFSNKYFAKKLCPTVCYGGVLSTKHSTRDGVIIEVKEKN